MTPRNSYATLADFKNYFTSRGGASVPADTIDDGVLEQLLESASRYLDSKTSRWFYPRIETRSYSIPGFYGGSSLGYGASSVNSSYSRELFFDADVLEIITFLNGDNTSIASTEYNLRPKNESPKYGLLIRQTSSIIWQVDSNGEYEYVLDLTAFYGFHNKYQDAWKVGSTLSEDLDTSETAWDVASGALFSAGQIVKVGNELAIVSSVASNTVNVVTRGDNGSTAAAHSTGATVYIWQSMEEARNAVCEIANVAKARRFGQSLSNTETVTAGGIAIAPRDIPQMAQEFIKTYVRRA